MSTYTVAGLGYPSFYLKDYEKAVAFYQDLFGGAEEYTEEKKKENLVGLKMGEDWITFFPAGQYNSQAESNPVNCEFAIRLSAPEEVDALHDAFVEKGATSCMKPQDTWMYENMRYCCVDDPFGIRVDIYCPIAKPE